MDQEVYNEITYENGNVRVIYEDNHMISVVKPQGILSQSDISGDIDLLSEIKKDIAVRKNKPGEAFVGLVHRLDRNTGGTMIFAKTSKGASRLSEELREKRLFKCYFALAEGSFDDKGGSILVNNLEKDEKTNTVRESKNGKPCRLFVKNIAKNEKLTLVAAQPITGRTHQIRAQMSLSGHPLLGDVKYGGRNLGKGNEDFLGLWSGLIMVKHPTKDVTMVFESVPDYVGGWKEFKMKDYIDGLEMMKNMATNVC